MLTPYTSYTNTDEIIQFKFDNYVVVITRYYIEFLDLTSKVLKIGIRPHSQLFDDIQLYLNVNKRLDIIYKSHCQEWAADYFDSCDITIIN